MHPALKACEIFLPDAARIEYLTQPAAAGRPERPVGVARAERPAVDGAVEPAQVVGPGDTHAMAVDEGSLALVRDGHASVERIMDPAGAHLAPDDESDDHRKDRSPGREISRAVQRNHQPDWLALVAQTAGRPVREEGSET